MNTPAAVRFVSAGEALIDLIRTGADTWLSRAGGAPWNVARVMAAWGVTSAFAGAVGRDHFGRDIAALTRAAGLDMRFLQQHDHATLLAIVHEIAPPQYYFIGAGSADLAFDPALLPPDWTAGVEWIHCGGISLARAPLAERVIDMLERAKAAGAKVSFDPNFRNVMSPAYDATLARVARIADVIKVSDEDLHGLFRTRDTRAALRQLRALNPQAAILLTLGAEGAQLHVQGEALRQRSARVAIADTLGAGDATAGGLLYSLMNKPKAAWMAHLRWAVAAGTAACLKPGASPPPLDAVEDVLARMD